MEADELDSILEVIESPVRRKIMKRLSEEPSYALQLSKELGLGQPLVAKHIAVMEAVGLVSSVTEKSPAGPSRKRYSLAKSLSISMDVAPNLFLERGVAIGPKGSRKVSPENWNYAKRVRDATALQDERKRLSALSILLDEIDSRMHQVEGERTELLEVRDQAMREAAKIAGTVDALDKKRILFHILNEHDMSVEGISETLNLREFTVRAILKELERDYFG